MVVLDVCKFDAQIVRWQGIRHNHWHDITLKRLQNVPVARLFL